MYVPPDAVIAPDKLTDYLLKPRTEDDKSRFLAQAGFVREHPHELEEAVRRLAAIEDAAEDGTNDYGVFYRVEGPLTGPDGVKLNVVTVWLR